MKFVWLRNCGKKRLRNRQGKQIWFLLRMVGGECQVRFDSTDKPEFDRWRWVDYWTPVNEIVSFKRKVYKQALSQLKRYA